MKQTGRFRFSIFLLSLMSAPSFGALSGYLDMESGSSRESITTTILNAATHASGGTWSVNTSLTHFMVSTSFETPLLLPVTVGGVTFNDVGSTRSFVFTNIANREFATYTFTQRTPKLSFGLYLRLSGFTGQDNSFDLVAVEAEGDFLVVNFQDRSSGFAYRVHTLDVNSIGPGGSGVGVPVPVVLNKTYWVTCLWDKANLTATLKVYDPQTWLLIGTSTNVIESRNAENLIIGRYDAHGGAVENSSTYFDDLIWDVTGATYPLFPASRATVATDATRAAFDAAYSAAAPGDTVVLPAGSNVWSSTYTLSKQSTTVLGVGTNTCIITNDTGGNPTFSVTAPFVTIRDLQITGIPGAGSGQGVETLVNHIRLSHLLLRDLADGTFFNGYGLIDHCTLIDCGHMGRHFGYIPGGAQVRAEQYPIPFNSTNYVVWEDCAVEVTPNMAGSSIVLFSSQEAASYIVRHTNIRINKLNIAPGFDFHGNDPTLPELRGVCGGQIYKVNLTINSPATFFGKFVDGRGGQLLVYSNKVTGFDVLDNVYLREEDSDIPPTDQVENTYVFQNYEGVNGTSFMPVTVDSGAISKIILNTHYFTNPPAGPYSSWSVPYPHPWTRADSTPGPGRPAPPSTLRRIAP
jgi:hypothetical protein